MGLLDALRAFTGAVNREYDRRVKAASNVREYDPTGASHHHHGHVVIENEQVVAVEDGANGHDGHMRPTTPAEQAAPRQVTHH